ncbi:sulfite exporter TauE/SafE family protein [Sphingopyxis sp. GW247-27LB]|uniref:sulfite exporter TauE/SafE family protein n=1 Tax=Sphingopyxis sp. GW247-27LB TaxID=2012632 RepID=UPI000BA58399|nr:sulfite exporter TauE/SafE family protein [Sphingopyxis sp. GW247-27LB]PAL22727.1 hypothetical protein CD928_11775 [Sphingopyxis sp. GW247-27LB]
MIPGTELSFAALLPFILIGFTAQLIDSALGMAFGVVGAALLLALGMPPASASAAIHAAESFTSGVSGLSHALQRNVDWRLFRRLVVPGIIGGLIGAFILVHLDIGIARPVVLTYLGAVGVYLMWRGARRPQTYRDLKLVGGLGFVGGVLDGSGGGGWGPVVTANLLAQGGEPRRVIGTANASEFFVTVTIAASFIGTLGWQSFGVMAIGLLIGGVLGAPVGAWLVRRLRAELIVTAAGALLLLASGYGFLALMFEPVPAFPRF